MATQENWHKADVRAALEKRGLTFHALDLQHGFPPGTSSVAARVPHFAGEEAIAAALGLHPSVIWPSRFRQDGTRLRPQPPQNYGRTPGPRHCQKAKAA